MSYEIKPLNEETKTEILCSIRKRLPEDSKVLFLSLTGSRAFGWAKDDQDYDIHGVVLREGYWDWMHLGEQGFDINLYEFSHVFYDIQHQHFETFMNWSNPFYIDKDFPFDELMNFCTLTGVKLKAADIQAQINRFTYDRSPRSALHAYRILMIPINFIETRKIELDVFKLNQKYRFEQLQKLKDAYNRQESNYDTGQINKDLDYLHNLYKEKITIETEPPAIAKAQEWMNNIRRNIK